MTLTIRNAQLTAVVICVNREQRLESHTAEEAFHRKKSTHSDGPPVTKLTDCVGQNESGKPENGQELMEDRGEQQEGGNAAVSDTV